MVTSATSPTAGETASTTGTGTGSASGGPVASPSAKQVAKATPEAVDDSPTHRIKYNGPSIHNRVIDTEDFKAVGSKQETLTWSEANRHTVLARLDEDAVALIKAQPDFKVTKIAGDDEDDESSDDES